MKDSGQEIRNGHINKDEGIRLIKKFDGEYPVKYEDFFYDYVGIPKDEFLDLCDKFRPNHIWKKNSNSWELKRPVWEYFQNNVEKNNIKN